MECKSQLKYQDYKFKGKKKPLIVFISGAGCDQTLWAYQNRYYLSKNFSTLLVNLPGHGRNDDKPLTTIENMSNYILKNLQETVHKSFIFISHSMGTLISLNIATKKIINIKKMILIGTSLPMKVSSYLLELSKKDQDAAICNMISWSLPKDSMLQGSQLIGMRLQNYLFRVMLVTRKGVLLKDLSACNKFNLSKEILKEIEVPICFISGDKDIMTPAENGIRLSNIIPNSCINIIQNCGHFQMFEYPNKLRSIISDFIG